MSLFNRKNFLDNYSFFFFIDIIVHRVTSGNVKTVDNNTPL